MDIYTYRKVALCTWRIYENLSPIIPMTIIVMKMIRRTSWDSLNKSMPRITVPTAPIPVHVVYAVPTGSVFSAFDRKKKLAVIAIAVHILGQNLVNPSVYFMPIAHTVSKRPAIKRYIQSIKFIRRKINVILIIE